MIMAEKMKLSDFEAQTMIHPLTGAALKYRIVGTVYNICVQKTPDLNDKLTNELTHYMLSVEKYDSGEQVSYRGELINKSDIVGVGS